MAGAGAEASFADMPWDEVKLYINDVILMYESTDSEHKSLSAIRQLRRDVESLTASAESDVKALISGSWRCALQSLGKAWGRLRLRGARIDSR